MPEVANARENHRQAGGIGCLDRSWSRSEPPGWMIAATPNAAALRTESSNGRKPSDASTAPLARSPALDRAILTASIRLTCPWPIPKVTPPRTTTIPLEVTCLATAQANRRSSHWKASGSRPVTTWQDWRTCCRSIGGSASWNRNPPLTRLQSNSCHRPALRCPAGAASVCRRAPTRPHR